MDSKSFLSIQEAAALLCVKVATIYSWVHQRRIPHRKHGRRLVFSLSDLNAWSHDQMIPVLPSGTGAFTLGTKCGNNSLSSLKTKEYGAKDHRRTAIGGNPFDEEGGTS